MAEFVSRIELYTQDWGCSFGEMGRDHYTVSRYGRGRALRGRPQCLPAAAAQREWRWRHPRRVNAARGRRLLRERACTTQTTLQQYTQPIRHATLPGLAFGKAYSVWWKSVCSLCWAWKSGQVTFWNPKTVMIICWDYFRLTRDDRTNVSRMCWCGLLLYMKVYNSRSYFL